MSDVDCTPGREPRSVAASYALKWLTALVCFGACYWNMYKRTVQVKRTWPKQPNNTVTMQLETF